MSFVQLFCICFGSLFIMFSKIETKPVENDPETGQIHNGSSVLTDDLISLISANYTNSSLLLMETNGQGLLEDISGLNSVIEETQHQHGENFSAQSDHSGDYGVLNGTEELSILDSLIADESGSGSGNGSSNTDSMEMDKDESSSSTEGSGGDGILSAIQYLLHLTPQPEVTKNGTEEHLWTTDAAGAEIPGLLFV